MSDNISLSIKSGESLSYVIDKQLDSELNTDVKLNLNEWNCIFNIIKNNQVETNQNQFTDKDTDIKNGKHFVVDANSTYEIKRDVWSQIVEIAKKRFGSQTVENTEVAATETNNDESGLTAQQKLDNDKNYLKTLLGDTSVKFDEEPIELQNDLVMKYRSMKAINKDIDEQTIKTRLENYVKGWKYHNFELKALNGKKPDDFKSQCKATQEEADSMNLDYDKNKAYDLDNDGKISAEEILKVKYQQFAKEYIEYYDLSGDGKIDLRESLIQNVQDYYRTQQGKGKNLSKADAYKKAMQLASDYQKGILVPDENGTPDQKLLAGLQNQIEFFDIGTDTGDDNNLSVDEVASMLLTQAQLNDSNNNITSQEVLTMHTGVSSNSTALYKKLEGAYRFLNS